MADVRSAQTIVFFDGVCHLCNAFVDFLVEQDHESKLHFTPLQGETAQKLLSDKERESFDTVLVWSQGKLLRKSEAIRVIFQILGGRWALFARFFALLPASARNRLYDQVAKRRYAWFGKRETCRLPTPQEKGRVLP